MSIKKLPEENQKEPNFIGSWSVEENICKGLIDYFNKNNDIHHEGQTADGIDKAKKNSTDLTIYPKNIKEKETISINSYLESLLECYLDYQNSWPFLKDHFNKLDIGPFNIQKYDEGGHFTKIHSERTSLTHLHRLFAFMTYLNDDFEGGGTFFSHYDLKITPITGKTLIWPAEWTHAHRGEIVTKGSKFIITGWLNIPLLDLK